MNGHPEYEQFARLIASLEPWLASVVIIGGWAHRLYRIHPSAQQVTYVPLMTLDTDVAVPARLQVTGQNVRERLMANGFEEERLGQDKPPATHYRLGDAKTGFYAEFLTPLFGAEHGRDGKSKGTRRIAGVVSQQLRHLEILLYAPWTVGIDRSNGFPFVDPKQVQIANPASFLAHKVLIHNKRTRGKLAKDILYIHDTLEIFGERLGDMSREWDTKLKPRIHPKSVRKIERAATDLFGEVDDEIREAAQMAGFRKLSAEAVRERCNFGLKRIFG
jgi:Nucleotidyltransferase